MSLRHGFIAVAIAFSLVLAGFPINRSRPKIYTEPAGGDLFAPPESARNATPAHFIQWFMNMRWVSTLRRV